MMRTRLALAAVLLLAACGESTEKPAAEEAATPQDIEFTPDFAAATREAVADTEAAVRAAGATIEAPVAAPAQADAPSAASSEAVDEEVEQ